jgi:hypothetical protein
MMILVVPQLLYRYVIRLVAILWLASSLLHADASSPSTPPSFSHRVLSDTDVVIEPKLPATNPKITLIAAHLEDFTPCVSYGSQKLTYSCTDDEKSGKATTYSSRNLVKSTVSEGLLRLTFEAGSFRSGRQYRLTYWQKDQTKPDPTSDSKTIDTRPLLTASFAPRGPSSTRWLYRAYLFRLESQVAFISGGVTAVSEAQDCPTQQDKRGWAPSRFRLSLDSSGKAKLGARKPEVSVKYLERETLDHPNYIGEGVVYICIDAKDLSQNFIPDPQSAQVVLNAQTNNPNFGSSSQFSDALGATAVSFAAETKLSPAAPPTGKSDSTFYANVNMVAATGARFAWGLDGKIAQLIEPLGPGTITLLSATANTGNNTSSIKGQTYSDSIDWTLPWTYQYFHGGDTPLAIGITFGPDYNTDIEFDRKNFLAAVDSLWTWKKLYQPQSYRTSTKNGALVKYPDPTLKPFGYGLQFHAGFEGGGALIDTTQQASSGKATISVPAYNIARVVPQIRGLVQWEPQKTGTLGLLTFDDTIVSRYLFATENTVEQYIIPASGSNPASIGLLLRPIGGWKAYNTLVGSWYPPNSANVAFTATYNDGFNPPKFSRVNSVTIGVTIMY